MASHLVVTDQWNEYDFVKSVLSDRGVDIVPHRTIGDSIYPPLDVDDQDVYRMFLIDLPGSNGSTANLNSFGLRMADAMAAFAINPVKTILVLHRNRTFTSIHTYRSLKAILDELRQHFPTSPIFDTLEEAVEWVSTEFALEPVRS